MTTYSSDDVIYNPFSTSTLANLTVVLEEVWTPQDFGANGAKRGQSEYSIEADIPSGPFLLFDTVEPAPGLIVADGT